MKFRFTIRHLMWLLILNGCDYSEEARRHQERMNQIHRENFEEQVAEAKKANEGRIGLYDTEEIDALLKQVQGMPEIHEIAMDKMPNLTDEGIASLATLPNLRVLDIQSAPVTENGLAKFRGHPALEKLAFTNTSISNECLRCLQEIPNLQSLTLTAEPRTGSPLTDSGLIHLESIPKLSELRIVGGWASKAAIAQLQTQLPNCKIYETDNVERR